MESIKNDENKKTNTNKGEKQTFESISKILKAVHPNATIEVFLFDKKKLDNTEEQLSYLTEVVNHESLFWEPDRDVIYKFIPIIKHFVDYGMGFRFKNCDLFHESDGSNGNIMMEAVSHGKSLNFATHTLTWQELRWITLVPFEFDNLPSSYVLVRIKNEWTDGQKLRDSILAIGKKIEDMGGQPKYGLLDKTLQTRYDRVRATYSKYKAISFGLLIAGLVISCLIIGALS
jgi:hypothetical protein